MDIDPGYKVFLIVPTVISLGAAWQVARGLGPPRFSGSIALLWLTAALSIPFPAYVIGGVAFWIVGLLFEQIGLSFLLGGQLGLALAPPLFCFLALRGLAMLFTGRSESGAG